MNGWDLALIVLVSIMGTAVAYINNPEHKAFMLMLPVPFTLATLSLTRPVDATNVLGLGVLFVFAFGVWELHARRRCPIFVAIAVCVVAYCVIGAGLVHLTPVSDAAFWITAPVMWIVSILLIRALPYRKEPSHRTPLPVWIKLPAVAVVIAGIVAIKQHLGGFMTTFPMIGVVAAYEARNSLWTIVRRIPWVMFLMTPMIAFIRLTQPRIGLPAALVLAWIMLLALLLVFRKRYMAEDVACKQENPDVHALTRT